VGALLGAAITSTDGSATAVTDATITGQDIAVAQGSVGTVAAYSAALTGQDLTSATGTVATEVVTSLVGHDITSATGTVATEVDTSLVGHDITSATGHGNVSEDNVGALLGAAITSTDGSATAVTDATITGQDISVAQGSVGTVAAYSAALTGQDITSATGTVATEVDTSLVGHDITSATGTVATEVDTGLTGQDITSATNTVATEVDTGLTGDTTASGQGNVSEDGVGTILGVSVTSDTATSVATTEIAISGQGVVAEQASVTFGATYLAEISGIDATVTHGATTVESAGQLLGQVAQTYQETLTRYTVATVLGIGASVQEHNLTPANDSLFSSTPATVEQGVAGYTNVVQLFGAPSVTVGTGNVSYAVDIPTGESVTSLPGEARTLVQCGLSDAQVTSVTSEVNPHVSVDLTGVAATSEQGMLSGAQSVSGASGSSVTGGISTYVSAATSGVEVPATQGVLLSQTEYTSPLVGSETALDTGSVLPNITVTLSGSGSGSGSGSTFAGTGETAYLVNMVGESATILSGQMGVDTVVRATSASITAVKGFIFTQLAGRDVEEWYVVKYRMGDVLRVIRY